MSSAARFTLSLIKRWAWRATKAALWFVVIAISWFTVRLMILGWNGEREWQEVVAQFAAEGVSLNLADYDLPPVPDDVNFGATPVLKDIALAVDGDLEKGEPAKRRKRFLNFNKQSLRSLTSRAEGTLGSGVLYGIPWNAADWATYCLELHSELKGQNLNAAETVLSAQKASNAWVDELAPDLDKPVSRFTPPPSKRFQSSPLSQFWLPQSDWLHAARWNLMVSTAAFSQTGKTSDAVKRIQCLCRLAEAQEAEGGVAAMLSSLNLTQSASEGVWHLLYHTRPSKDELTTLLHSLGTADPTLHLQRQLEMESVALLLSFDWIEQHASPSSIRDCCAAGDDMTLRRWDRDFCIMLVHFWPRGAWLSLRAHLMKTYLTRFLIPLKKGGLSEVNRAVPAFRDELYHKGAHGGVNDLALASLLSMMPTSIGDRPVMAVARLRQAQLALALEHYFAVNGRYPDDLTELVPQFASAIPADPINDQPMRYAKAGAHYKLWSVGYDNEDDGGRVLPGRKDDPSAPYLLWRDNPGDWVWSYQRLVPEKQD